MIKSGVWSLSPAICIPITKCQVLFLHVDWVQTYRWQFFIGILVILERLTLKPKLKSGPSDNTPWSNMISSLFQKKYCCTLDSTFKKIPNQIWYNRQRSSTPLATNHYESWTVHFLFLYHRVAKNVSEKFAGVQKKTSVPRWRDIKTNIQRWPSKP